MVFLSECFDSFFKWWMWHKHFHHSMSSRNLECCHRLFFIRLNMSSLRNFFELFKCLDHLCFSYIFCTTSISTIFTMTRERHEDDLCQETKYDIEYNTCEKVDYRWTTWFSIITCESSVDNSCYEAWEEYDECIHHTLHKRHSDHITIENMRHLMGNNPLDLIFIHSIQESTWYSDKSFVFWWSCCKCVCLFRLIDSYFRCRDMLYLSNTVNYFIDELFFFAVLMKIFLIDKCDIITSLCHPSRNRKWYEWSSETNDCWINKESSHARIIPAEIHSKYWGYHEEYDADHHHDSNIRQNKESNSFEHKKKSNKKNN